LTAAITPFGDDIATHDAAEDVDQDALHCRIGRDDLERCGHLLLGGATAHVEEVGRLGAIELDDVHRRHGKARAIDHAADIAVERHIGEVELGRFDLLGVFFGEIAQRPSALRGGTPRCCRSSPWRRARAGDRRS
jgi:hypothetical protein